MATYHVGLSKRGSTMIIETAHCVDHLGCEIYDYMGERVTTKKQLKESRYGILSMMQARRPDVYGNLKYAIVE